MLIVEKAVYPLDYLVARLSRLVGRPLSQQNICFVGSTGQTAFSTLIFGVSPMLLDEILVLFHGAGLPA